MFIIGKSKNSRCFKNVKHLPYQYVAQKKSWRNSQIFEDWVGNSAWMKKKLLFQAHPSISNLTNIQLVSLPSNTTSILQLIKQDVIRSLIVQYRGRVVRLLCSALEKNEPYPKISILEAMKILADSWEAVTKEIIINCFKRAGISSDVQQAAITDSEDPFNLIS